ncbi:MAG: nitroreductase family protein [Halioglobus sp.]
MPDTLDLLTLLQTRNSSPKLTSPAPTAHELEAMVNAALRAPDHAWLRPTRFIVIEGEQREALGRLFETSLLARNPDADENARAKALGGPLRAPLMVVVTVQLKEHPKVPHSEQRLSAGCAAYALLLAAEALGYAGIWRTGDNAFDPKVASGLGLELDQEIVGFIYLGTRTGKSKTLPTINPVEFISRWTP